MTEAILRMGKLRQGAYEDMVQRRTSKARRLFKALKLDNVTYRKHTVRNWDKYRAW